MELNTEEMDGGIVIIRLLGRMDMRGAEQVDLKVAGVTAVNHGKFIVDMSGVDFLASIGIRTLLMSAKAVKARGGMLVLFRPVPLVADVLDMAGIADLIPVFHEFDPARVALTAA